MKKFLSAASLFLAALAATSASATEFCPAGTLTQNIYIPLNDTSNPSHTISNRCITNPDTDIVLDGSMMYGNSATPPTTVSIGPGLVLGRRSVINIRGCTNEIALANRAAFVINIFDNDFGNDAIIFFNAALPVNSQLTISGNRFNASTPIGTRMPAPFTSVSTWASGLIFNDLALFSSSIEVTNNNIYGSDVTGVSRIIGVYVSARMFFMGDNCSFVVAKNNITTVCNPISLNGICGYGVQCPSLYAYTSGRYSIDDNNFFTAGALVNNMPDIINPLETSVFTFDRNVGKVNTMYLPHTISSELQPFTMFNTINVQGRTSISMQNNTFEVNGDGGMIGLFGDFILLDNTSMIIARNKITTQGCDPSIFVGDHSHSGASKFQILYNQFYRDDDTAVTKPMMYFEGTFGLKDKSKMYVGFNNYGGREPIPASAPVNLITLSSKASTTNFVFDPSANLYVCSNSINNVTYVTTNDVKSKISNALHARVLPSGCGAAPVTTTTRATTSVAPSTTVLTTTGPLTGAPNSTDPAFDNGASHRAAFCQIVVVMLAAIFGLAWC